MTNGDKLLSVFEGATIYGTYKEKGIIKVCVDNSYVVPFDLGWWNSEYKESEAESLDNQRAVEDTEYCERHEPTYNPDDGSM